jgi:hypothetical protein
VLTPITARTTRLPLEFILNFIFVSLQRPNSVYSGHIKKNKREKLIRYIDGCAKSSNNQALMHRLTLIIHGRTFAVMPAKLFSVRCFVPVSEKVRTEKWMNEPNDPVQKVRSDCIYFQSDCL